MTSKERMQKAMSLSIPDRVPVMCQLALGHYFKYAGIDPLDIWYTSEGFATALVTLQKQYVFDGILINLPGRAPNYKQYINNIEHKGDKKVIHWSSGGNTVFPPDDLPYYNQPGNKESKLTITDVDPDKLFYIEPYDVTGISYPYTWGFEEETRPFDNYFPEYHMNTIKYVREKTGDTVSVHSEIFSPLTQLLELLGYENALIALLDDPEKVKACLQRLAAGAADLGQRQAAEGVDAILISSAFAGGGFLSVTQYDEFVLPYEKKVIEEIKKTNNSIPVYTHTCGIIGDRLDRMIATGINGIDTLDPPPLGDVDLREAKNTLHGKAFIKGNIDPVNVLLQGDKNSITKNVIDTLQYGKPDGGYILSTACSVSPHTPPENIILLAELVEKYGWYY